MILKFGSFKTSLLAILLSRERSNDGKSNKLASMANNRVVETSAPKATVPPKFDITKTENPKNKTMDV